MSILPQNHTDEVELLDCVQNFFSKHHLGKLLKQCNGTKEKGVSAVSLLKYKLGNISLEKACTCSNVPVPSRKISLRIRFIVF